MPSVLPLLQSAQPPIETVLTSVLNELSATPNDVDLVLDDYHLVDGPDLRDGMTFLLEHLPPHVHLVISSRADPLLPLARLRARGELVEVRAADLRFTPDEVAAYLNDVIGLDLAPDDIAALEGRTEGWIAALQLAAISMQGRTDIGGFIAQFAGNDRYIVDYLVEEVLQAQPDPVREFLLHTAVLDRLTGPLCDAVTGRDDGSQLLITLERANLFLVPLDDRREWYRYHHLFADVLRAHLLAEQPDLVPVLHQRASLWYERHDLTEEAVRHALAARDFDRAAYLMELAAPAIRRHRQEAMLLGWLQGTARRHRPAQPGAQRLLRIHADGLRRPRRRSRPDSTTRNARWLPYPAGQASPWADTEELRTLPATIAIYRASLAQARGDVAGTAEHARRALDLAGPDDHLARGGAAGFLGLAAWANGDVTSALETFTQAVASLHAADNLVDELSSTVTLADMWLAAGRPSKARRLYQGALQLGRGTRPTRGRCNGRPARGDQRDRRRSRRPRERQTAPRDRRRYRRPFADERAPLPVVRGHGPARQRRRRPRGGRQPPRPGGAAVPSRLPSGCATHRGDEGPGPDLRRAGCPRPPTGHVTEGCPPRTMPAI